MKQAIINEMIANKKVVRVSFKTWNYLRTIPIFLGLMIWSILFSNFLNSPLELLLKRKNNNGIKKKETQNLVHSLLLNKRLFLLQEWVTIWENKHTFKKKIWWSRYYWIQICGDEWWIYGTNENDYYQVAVSEEDTINIYFCFRNQHSMFYHLKLVWMITKLSIKLL